MTQDISICLIQTPLVWQEPSANIQMLDKKIASVSEPMDVILLPEMFTSGFTMSPQDVAEDLDGLTINWMKHVAQTKSIALVGSLVIKANDNFYNRLIWVNPNGSILHYDKRHLFAMAGEDEVYTAGEERVIINYKGWKFCPQICYDLRFPVWSRNTSDFDVLFYLANWPDRRVYDWKTLLAARAIENQCYSIGVNRVGDDPNGHHYYGESCVFDPGWNKLLYSAESREEEKVITLSYSHLRNVRAKLPFLKDRDQFEIL